MPNLDRLFKHRRIWFLIAMAVPACFFVVNMLYDPMEGTALDGAQGYIMAALIMPAAGLVYLFVQRIIEDRVHSQVSQLLLGEEGGAPAKGPVAERRAEAAAKDEVATITADLKTALATLRKRRFGLRGRRWLYQLPWYVVLGPSGSGKTTAILNSGLRFPLAGRQGAGPLRGIAGTRYCDWWFTDEAVLIDTAGRYTTQDQPAGPESGAYLGFLRLLRKHRRREPINGILVFIGLEMLAGPPEKRRQHADSIRDRMRELYAELGLRIPVYVVVPKLDLLEGFVEFFDDLGGEGRKSVWGVTFDLPSTGSGNDVASAYDTFPTEYDTLVDNLDARLVERLQQESDGLRRGRLFGFPQRVANLRDPLADFLREAFAPSSFEDPFLLRGVYLVSGTQSPQRFGGILRQLTPGHAESRPGTESKPGRSYFLSRLLREVVFHEAGLVATDPRKLRRHRIGTALGQAAIAATVLLFAGSLLHSYLRGQNEVAALSANLGAFAAEVADLGPNQVEEPDLASVLPALGRLRDARDEADAQGPGGRLFGRGEALQDAAASAYAHGLQTLLLPRLILLAEDGLQRGPDDKTAAYQTLKAYLMLGGKGPLEPEFVAEWVALATRTELPSAGQGDLREELAAHTAALLDLPLQEYALDPSRLQAARSGLADSSAAARVLATIAASEAAATLLPWRLVENAGPEADRVFGDRRGPIDSSAVPGLYTREGFYSVFLPQFQQAAAAQAREIWVIEDRPPLSEEEVPAVASRLAAEAAELYLREVSLRWDETLDAVAIQPLDTLDDALRMMNTLASSTSPVRLLLASVVEQTSFDLAPESAEAGSGDTSGTAAAFIAETPEARAAQQMAARFAEGHFRDIRALVEVPGNSQEGAVPPVDQVIADLGVLYRQLRDMQVTDAAGPLDANGEAALVMRQVRSGAARLPEPVQSWISDVSTASVSRSASTAREQLNQRWQEGPAALCREVTRGRYPFAGGASREVSLQDFGALFGPDGEIDRFIRTNLDNIVDRTGPEWRWNAMDGLEGELNQPALAAMERAAQIRDTMFIGAGRRPSVSFQVTLTEIDPEGASLRLNVNGQTQRFERGSSLSARMHWPGSEGRGLATLSFPQFLSSREPGYSDEGNWALYRLIDRAERRERLPESGALRLRFRVGDRIAGLVLQSDTGRSVVDRRFLSDFQCPESF